MKQPSSLLNNVCSKCKVTYNFQEWHQNIKLQIFIQVNITVGKKLKTCQEQPHLLSGHFVVRTPPLPFLLPLHTGGRSSFSKLMEMGRFENFCYKSRGKAKWGVCLEMGGFPYYIGVFLKIPFVFILPLLTNMYFKIIA